MCIRDRPSTSTPRTPRRRAKATRPTRSTMPRCRVSAPRATRPSATRSTLSLIHISGRRQEHPPDSRCDAAHRTAPLHGRGGGAARGGRLRLSLIHICFAFAMSIVRIHNSQFIIHNFTSVSYTHLMKNSSAMSKLNFAPSFCNPRKWVSSLRRPILSPPGLGTVSYTHLARFPRRCSRCCCCCTCRS